MVGLADLQFPLAICLSFQRGIKILSVCLSRGVSKFLVHALIDGATAAMAQLSYLYLLSKYAPPKWEEPPDRLMSSLHAQFCQY